MKRDHLKRESRGFFIFLPTLCISLVVLSALFLLFTLYTKVVGVEIVKKDVPAEYQHDKEESLSAVVLGCKEETDLPEFVMAFYYDALNGKCTFVILPPETVVTKDGRTDTIAGHYDYAGTQGGITAVGEVLGTNIMRYIRIQQSGISDLADFLGGINWEVSSDTVVGGQQIFAGKQLLNGRRISAFLFDTETLGVSDVNVQATMCRILFKNAFTKNFVKHYSEFVSIILGSCDTDLSQYDFLIRQKGFENHLKNGTIHVNSFALIGEYNVEKTKFFADSENIIRINAIFPQNTIDKDS